jgi:undecaprenyl pyrophosphate phosphatase UppP
MSVFLNLLSKKSISAQDVETMTSAAADIMGALGCNPATIPGTSATSSRVMAAMR